MSIATSNALVSGLLPRDRVNPLLRDLVLIVAGSFLLALASQYKLPIGPVPINMTTLVVLLIGATYGWRLGGATVLAYFMEGVALSGMIPWFANGSGLAYFIGAPSAGFLWGYLPEVMVVGFLADTLNMRKNALTLFAAMLAGQAVLYAIGLAHAYFIVMPAVNWMNNVDQMLAIYLTPFVLGAVLKTAIATLLTIQGWQWLEARRR